MSVQHVSQTRPTGRLRLEPYTLHADLRLHKPSTARSYGAFPVETFSSSTSLQRYKTTDTFDASHQERLIHQEDEGGDGEVADEERVAREALRTSVYCSTPSTCGRCGQQRARGSVDRYV